MENKENNYHEMINYLKALNKDLKPLYSKIRLLAKELDSFNKTSVKIETGNALSDLMLRVTRTSRRHEIEKTLPYQSEEKVKIGTNHQGIGFIEKYSRQLTPLCDFRVSFYHKKKLRFLRKILMDNDVVIELASLIKKSNQKTFLKAVKIINQTQEEQGFEDFKEKEVGIINQKINSDKQVISLQIWGNTLFVKLFSIDRLGDRVETNSFKFSLERLSKPEEDLFFDDKKFIPRYDERKYDLNDIKLNYMLRDYQEEFIPLIEGKIKLLKEKSKKYLKENEELIKLLSPFLALEKL